MKNKTNQGRRKFLKNGLKSAALASVLPAVVSENSISGSKDNEKGKIVYRTLGRTGIKVPIVSMGAGDTDNPNLIKAAIDSGVTLFATSPYYGNGKNEKMLGEIMKNRARDSVTIITSAVPEGIDYQGGLFTEESKAEPFIRSCEQSLKNLGTDCIDIFLLPFAAKRESVFFEPLLKAMEQIKKQGKAKYLGIATHSYETEAINAAVETGIYDVVMTAYNFKNRNSEDLNKAIDDAVKAGLGIIAMKTMAGVYWDKEKTLPINSRAALKWVLRNENIHTAVPGITTFDQLKNDISVMSDLILTEQEKSDLKLARKKARSGLYCQHCGECVEQCPESVDIPTIMRSYMYAYGYRNIAHASKTLTHVSSLPCMTCKTCEISCPSGFNVREKVLDIARLRDVPEDFLM